MRRSFIGLFALTMLAARAAAHEVPDDVRVRLYAKPSGNKLQIIVRMPANAFIDYQFPSREDSAWLDIPATNAMLPAATYTWVADLLTIYEGDTLLDKPVARVSLLSRQSDPSFASYAQALAHVTGPKLPDNELVMLDRAVVDVLLETPIRSDRDDFTLVPRFGRLGVLVTTTVNFLPPGGGLRTYEYEGDPEPFKLNPTWDQSAAHFIEAGFLNIFDETDYLLLLFCVALLFRDYRAFIPFAVVFTLAHSFALIGLSATLPAAWLPPLAGTLMALSVVYLALECVVNPDTTRKRELFAVASGLAFGTGFWFSLRPVLQFGGDHPVLSLLSFNLGIEICQVLVLTLLGLFFHFVAVSRVVSIILAVLVAHMAWHRMTERAYALNRFASQLQWPFFDLRWMLAALVAAALVWLAFNRKTLWTIKST